MFTVIDHTEPVWADRYTRSKQENGAATYSRDIIKHHLPAIQELTKDMDAVVSTAPLMHKITGNATPEHADLAIQYLHTYPYTSPLADIEKTAMFTRGFADRTIFITAYKQMELELKAAGYEAMWQPMAIDTEAVRAAVDRPEHYDSKRIIYFGNITGAKQITYREMERSFMQMGWQFDYISGGKYRGVGRPLSQEEAWRIIAQYQYGVGVGRCALEMMALGLKVMIAGAYFGGIMVDEHDFESQHRTNMNGRIITFSHDVQTCQRMLPHSLVKSVDIRDTIPHLTTGLKKLIDIA